MSGLKPFPRCRIDGIVVHWTAGAYGLNSVEDGSYNYIVQPDGTVQEGDFDLAAQTPPLVHSPRSYAAHTRQFNSYRAGVSMDAMGDAKERPFTAGRWPVTQAQVEATARLCAAILNHYGLPLTRKTCCTHAEVPTIHGVAQPGKWDVRWLPGMSLPGDAVDVGDDFRATVRKYM